MAFRVRGNCVIKPRVYIPKGNGRIVKCHNCEKEFSGKWIRTDRKFCTRNCSREHTRKKFIKLNPGLDYNRTPGAIGSINQITIACDLLKRDYEVFTPLNLHSSCDLIALKGNKLLRIEVTTGRKSTTGRHYYFPHRQDRYDVLALVFYDGEIIYSPDL